MTVSVQRTDTTDAEKADRRQREGYAENKERQYALHDNISWEKSIL